MERHFCGQGRANNNNNNRTTKLSKTKLSSSQLMEPTEISVCRWKGHLVNEGEPKRLKKSGPQDYSYHCKNKANLQNGRTARFTTSKELKKANGPNFGSMMNHG